MSVRGDGKGLQPQHGLVDEVIRVQQADEDGLAAPGRHRHPGFDDDGAEDSDDEEDESEEEIEQEDEVSLDSLVGPIKVTVSMTGYDTQSFTVDLDTFDDSDPRVALVPSA